MNFYWIVMFAIASIALIGFRIEIIKKKMGIGSLVALYAGFFIPVFGWMIALIGIFGLIGFLFRQLEKIKI